MKNKKKKLKSFDVQKSFNSAIIRRDKVCRVIDGNSCCSGRLQCSHFFTVGGNGALRFYPFNAFAQCASHHLAHHHRNPLFYAQFMQHNYAEELEFMERVRGKPLHYSQEILFKIKDFCDNDNLLELRNYLRELMEGNNG